MASPTQAQLISKLQHHLMTCRDDLEDPAEAKARWAMIFDILVKADLTISAVTITKVPRTAGQAKDIQTSLGNSPVLPFKKYQGRTVAEVAQFDLDYLRWLDQNVPIHSTLLSKAIKDALRGPEDPVVEPLPKGVDEPPWDTTVPY